MSNDEDLELENALAEVERSLFDLKERYAQIKADRQRQIDLGGRREDVLEHLRKSRGMEKQKLKQELKEIKKELETIEFNLESSLFTWGSLKEPFWQTVRFVGLGMAMGWLLKSCS